MKGSWIAACCVTWLLCGSFALGHREEFGSVIPEPERSGSTAGLSAVLVLSTEPEEVLRSWATRAASLSIDTADTVTRDVPIVAFVFFSGCLPDRNGLCNASADFTILEPDGSVYERIEDLDLWKDKPAPPAGTLRLAAEYVGVVIEAQDPLGEYEFRVTLHDRNAGTRLELSRPFTATAGKKAH